VEGIFLRSCSGDRAQAVQSHVPKLGATAQPGGGRKNEEHLAFFKLLLH